MRWRTLSIAYGPARNASMVSSRSSPAYVSRRTLDSHAAFLRRYLRAGLEVLDVGCGPGSITLGIASEVEPGRVVGVDREPSQIEAATRAAIVAGLENVTFESASAYELPF